MEKKPKQEMILEIVENVDNWDSKKIKETLKDVMEDNLNRLDYDFVAEIHKENFG